MSGARYTPEELAELLSTRKDPVHPPTAQQREVILAPADRPALVMAGAGSGKTETMAARVVHLVANGLPPGGVLGLTFTRKAAGELAERIRRRLDRLRQVGVLTGDDALDLPTVSTYNAWAGSIYREHALHIGREPDAEVVGEAASWLLARRIVLEHGDPALVDLGQSVARLTDAVLRLSNAMTEHVVDPERLDDLVEAFTQVGSLEPLGIKKYDGPVEEHVADVGALRLLVPLVEQYQAAKRRRGVIEFSDQVASALEICQRVPEAVAELRERHEVVILDEYQDTSVVQARLLARIFAGTGVMAVGDPNQAIYGWRGASAANLAGFAAEFARDDAPVRTFQLTTSWRNPPTVLEAANRIADPLRTGPVQVEWLAPRPGGVDGELAIIYAETVRDEAEEVAGWVRDRLEARRDPASGSATAAIIMRKRAHLERFGEALRRLGVPHHIVGGGGLLGAPEVVDLVATLRVLVDPDAGSALIRLLTGARWRIGLADLDALRGLAHWLQLRDTAHRPLDTEVAAALRGSALPGDGASIIDALDALVSMPEGHRALEGFSAPGLARLREVGAELRRLRGRLGLPLPDLVDLVAEAMRLDIEVVANELEPGGQTNLRAFRHEVEGFVGVEPRASVSALLAWIDRAADDDREMSPAAPPSEPGVVQLITVHGAKGLEWDIVAIPRLVEAEFPTSAQVGRDWLAFGRLPGELRGDAAELPSFGWRSAADRREYLARFETYRAELLERHEQEERRLAYVAVTRTRSDLLLSGAWWGGQQRPRKPSRYLEDCAAAFAMMLPAGPDTETPPEDLGQPDLRWPRPALGDRRERVERAAELVLAAMQELETAASGVDRGDLEGVTEPGQALPEPLASAPWARDLALLLAEHAIRGTAAPPAPPRRVPASGFKAWVQDPAARLRAIQRPMPEQPYVATRLGTLFHDWVEARYRRLAPEALFDLDELGVSAEDELVGLAPADQATLARLKDVFERSRWATRRPLAVERAIDLPLGGVTIPCKIDAVFPADDDPDGVTIVDWKTGRRPDDPDALALLDYQLDLYRLAWAAATGTPVEHIEALLYFVASDEEYAPTRYRGEAELTAEWGDAIARLG